MAYTKTVLDELRSLQGGGRGKALLAIASSSFLLIGVQMIYPVLLPELRSAYDLGLTTAGLLLTALWVANAVGQLPGGMLADRIGEGRTIVASVVLSAITLALIVTAVSVLALFAATVLLGFAIALFGVARYTALHDLFPEQVGTTIGIVLAAADAGQALLPPFAGFVAVAFLWQFGFGFTIPLFVLVALVLWLYVPGRTSREITGDDTVSLATVRSIVSSMRTRAIGYGTAAFIVYVVIWVAFTGFYPTYLIEVKGQSSTVTGILFGLFFATGVVVKPLSGAAYDRVGTKLSLLAIAAISIVGLVSLPFVEGIPLLIAATVLVAPILGSGTIAQSHLVAALPSEIRGTGLGVIRSAVMGMAALSPAAFGAAAERGFFDEAFLALAGLAGLMILFVVRIPSE